MFHWNLRIAWSDLSMTKLNKMGMSRHKFYNLLWNSADNGVLVLILTKTLNWLYEVIQRVLMAVYMWLTSSHNSWPFASPSILQLISSSALFFMLIKYSQAHQYIFTQLDSSSSFGTHNSNIIFILSTIVTDKYIHSPLKILKMNYSVYK